MFIESIAKQSDIELTRHSAHIELSDEQIETVLAAIPYCIGMEYVNRSWIIQIWHNLNIEFSQAINGFDGTVESFLIQYNSNIHVVGRVFFHLVETKN